MYPDLHDCPLKTPTLLGYNDTKYDYWREQFILMYGSLEAEQHTQLFRELLHSVLLKPFCSSNENMVKLLFKLVAHTRDILHGKGERYLCYRMIYEWCLIDMDGGIKLLETCVRDYGCWKDVKYFCDVVRSRSVRGKDDELIMLAAKFMNEQLRVDWYSDEKASLVCKWIPREKSAFGWLFDKMALQWCYMVNPHILNSAEGDGYVRAITKCKMQYRKVLSSMNRYVGVAEVKKCAGKWAEIKPVTITVDGLVRQTNSYLNVTNAMEDAFCGLSDHKGCSDCSADRNIASLHTKAFFTPFLISNAHKVGVNELKVTLPLRIFNAKMCTNGNFCNDKTFSNEKVHSFVPGDFVKRAIHLIDLHKSETNIHVLQNILYQMELLNQLWNHFSKNVNAINLSIVPVIDMSLAMNHMAMCHAIGLGCVVAAKTKLGQRVIVMDHTPTWIILESMEFVDMVKTIVLSSACRTARNVQGVFDFFDAQTGPDIVGSGDVTFCFFSSGSSAKELSERAWFWNCCSVGETNDGSRVIGSGTNAYLLNRVFLRLCTFQMRKGVYKKDNAFDSIQAMLEDPQYHRMDIVFDGIYSSRQYVL